VIRNLKDNANLIDHVFIARQYRVDQDNFNVYVLSKLIQGIDLFNYIDKHQKITCAVARPLIAGIVLIL